MRNALVRLSLAAALGGLMAASPLAQAARPADAGQQTITRQQADEIIQELKQIKLLLERMALQPRAAAPQPQAPPPNQPVTIRSLTGYMLGQPNAPLTMVEFTDLQCPFCRQFHVTAFDQIKKKYIDTGELRYFTVDFPLSIHPLAMEAAEAARCAGAQGQFWAMRHTIFLNNAALTPGSFDAFARDLKLNPAQFNACVSAGTYQKAIAADQQLGIQVGVSGTPTFIIGRSMGVGVTGIRIVGAQPFAVFDQQISALAAQQHGH